MIKNIFLYTLVFFALYFFSHFLHQSFIEKQKIILPFSLQKVYLFHTGFSLLVCMNLVLFSNVNKIIDQLGFIYLGTILLKLVLFSLLFYSSTIINDSLAFSARISLLIPLIIFLLTEAFFVSKILKRKE